ncbi:hypothetical protein ORIO_23640 (plasmid) [Cereibacter azotoformans]|uniref:hypothetical protein n=1 Tax=Cereibacter TaxID=1653176 RepID=UPI001324E8CC|nr:MULTISPECIES: hypothetical protein [Cereibacter]MWP39604.1 hypothetical protein [Cereibacter sphaeroides]ULB12758.1 hypothetical protein ORIO_23640 [Cereibacter azotoformans]
MKSKSSILSAWRQVLSETARYLPFGGAVPEDRPGLYRRVARDCGVPIEAVRRAVEASGG